MGGGKRGKTLTRRNITAIFAVVLFATAAFVALYETPDGSDAAAGDFQYEYNGVTLEYTVTSSTAPLAVSVVGWVGSPTNIIIPDTAVGPAGTAYAGKSYKVTAVGDLAFYNCNSLLSIDFGNSVETIGVLAFQDCIITSIDLGNVKTIKERAFLWCHSLASVASGNSVETVEYAAFYQCYPLTGMDLSNVKTIGIQAFAYTSLKTVNLNSVEKTIGDWAFMGCTSLVSVNLGINIDTIERGAFRQCSALTSVDLSNVKHLVGAFAECTSLKDIDLSNVEIIGDNSFWRCKSLTSVDLRSATTIEEWAFEECDVLESVTIDSGATISANAFLACPLLDTVIITGNNTTKVIQTYFSNGGSDWYLPGAVSPAEYLFLDDLDSTVYDPDGTPGIAGDTGRKLWFGVNNAAYAWDPISLRWVTPQTTPYYDVSGTVTFSDGTPAGGVRVSLGQHGAYTDASGDYTISNIPFAASGDVIASLSGYSQTSYPRISHISRDMTGIDMELTATGAPTVRYTVTFDSGPEYTVYVGSSPLHSAVKVTGGDDLTFSIRVSDGYTVRPSLSGTADMYLQTNGWYVLHEISSDVHVNISVQSDGNGSGGGSGTGGGSGSGSNGGVYGPGTGGSGSGGGYGEGSNGNGNRGSDSGDISFPYWVPVLIIAAILGCMFLLFIIFRRRKDEEEE
jgi:hypothetical protein